MMQIREETPGDFDQIAALLDLAFGGTEESGLAATVVVGHPEYYPRFGFSAAAARPLRAPFRGPAFMAMELVPGCLEHLPTLRGHSTGFYCPVVRSASKCDVGHRMRSATRPRDNRTRPLVGQSGSSATFRRLPDIPYRAARRA